MSASSGPEASTVSSPCSAGSFVPRTGASTNATPRRAASWASRSVAAIPTVLDWIQIAFSPAPSSASPATSATTRPSGSIVSMNAVPRTASAGVSATVTPAIASAAARVRFQTRTSNPAFAKFRAIGAPMVPVPSTAIGSTGRTLPAVWRVEPAVKRAAALVALPRFR